MKRTALLVIGGFLLGFIVDRVTLVRRYSAVIAARESFLVSKARDHISTVNQEKEAAVERSKFLEQLLNSQLMNNDEIERAAAMGDTSKARKIRAEWVKQREDMLRSFVGTAH